MNFLMKIYFHDQKAIKLEAIARHLCTSTCFYSKMASALDSVLELHFHNVGLIVFAFMCRRDSAVTYNGVSASVNTPTTHHMVCVCLWHACACSCLCVRERCCTLVASSAAGSLWLYWQSPFSLLFATVGTSHIYTYTGLFSICMEAPRILR